MRVAVFTDNDFSRVDGVRTSLAGMLAHTPVDVLPRIYTASALRCDQPGYLAVRSRRVPLPLSDALRVDVPQWREYLRRSQQDGIELIHLTTPGPVGVAARWVAKRSGLPLVGSVHLRFDCSASGVNASRVDRWLGRYLRWLYGECDAMLVPSAAARAALTDSGFSPERITVWPSGVDTTMFDPVRRSNVLRASWRSDRDHPVLVYVGRLSPDRGVDLLPPILWRLRALGFACRLVVIGDGPYRTRLAEVCPEAICAGTLGQPMVAEALASADLFVFPTRSESSGHAVLEAQASGLPVIMSNGCSQESVLQGVTGVICPGTDPDRWAATVATVLRDEEGRRAMSIAARRFAATRQWDRTLEPLFDTYRRLHHAHTPANTTARRQLSVDWAG